MTLEPENSKKSDDKEKIIMLATDGQIGNEDAIIEYVKANFDGRVFCIGIDVNVNDSFLNKLASVGNGFAEFYYPNSSEDLTKKVVKQFVRSNAPYLTSLRLDADGAVAIAGKIPKHVYSGECYNMVFKTDKPVST